MINGVQILLQFQAIFDEANSLALETRADIDESKRLLNTADDVIEQTAQNIEVRMMINTYSLAESIIIKTDQI